jgi:signal transduction histidine kinase
VLVTDTGVGIPQESMKHLFEKFFRVEKNKGMARGSGLGLNLTRQIIEAIHRGRMIVRSEEGKGSTFGFALPIAA